MQQADFVDAVTGSVARHLAGNYAASNLAHSYADNLREQMKKISHSNPKLDALQVLSVMFAEDPESNVFEVAFAELQDPSRALLALKFHNVPEPKVQAIVIGKSTM